MSIGSEYLADHAFEMYHPFGIASDTWRTKDGREIKLTDMTDSHIKNCMRLIGEDDEWYWRFKEELDRRMKDAI